ncbi:TIGR02281 family clan AA aspartic protease [Gayadomonas joobiniege]|uniref:TIGR02281 family clan AA aspartic protease n=1 Tax=Gayadomonas joobiniege TaxID=1234606 RepID=UPI00036499E4|nr:TIGR02281 family clan AA aspartic protease [Gayadomonas joobiniege]
MIKLVLSISLLVSIIANLALYQAWQEARQVIVATPPEVSYQTISAQAKQAFVNADYLTASQLAAIASDKKAIEQAWYQQAVKALTDQQPDLAKNILEATAGKITRPWLVRLALRYHLALQKYSEAADIIYSRSQAELTDIEYQSEWLYFEAQMLAVYDDLKQQGHWEKAAKIFETLYWYQDDHPKFSLALAESYYHLGKKSQAEQILLYVAADPDYQSQAEALQAKLLQKTVKYPLNRTGAHYILAVKIGQQPANLMIDTGASITSLSRQFVEQYITDYQHLGYKTVSTANGLAEAEEILVAEFTLGTLTLNDFTLLILDNYFSHNDGLLGMNFLSRFKFNIDQQASMLVLTERKSSD